VDVVDEDDHVLMTVERSAMRRENLRHRAVFIAVRSSSGGVLVHRRSDDKDVWPGFWDLAVGGVVTAGESYRAAARREVTEELGVEPGPLVALGGGRFEDESVRLVARVFTTVHDGPFEFADGEIVEARFVAMDELARLVSREPFVPDSVALVFGRL
jgi:isopentenyldiphosphate isomerase